MSSFNLLDAANIFMGSYNGAQQNARANQEARMRREQFDFEKDRVARQDKAAEAAAAQQAEERKLLSEFYKNGPEMAPGVEDRLREANPRLYAEVSQQRVKQQQEAQSKQAEGEKIAANLQRALATAPTPEAREAINQRMFELTKRGVIPRTEITGPQTAPGNAVGLGAQADAVLGPEAPDTSMLDPIAKQVVNETGFRPRTPEFRRAYVAARREEARERLLRAKAVGGKDLPVTAAQDLADADTAMAVVDDLFDSFVANVPSGGVVEQVGSRIGAEVPNSDAAAFDNEADVGTQVVGSFLEGGKLAEGDFKRYRKFMPRPGDSLETAEKKRAAIKSMIGKRTESRRSALGKSYKVPTAAATGGAAAGAATANAAGGVAGGPQFSPEQLEAIWGN